MVTRGSDNPFPSVLFVEHVDPSNPSAGTQRLFVDTDHVLKLIDSSGTVTTFSGGGFSDPMTTRGDIIIRNASNVTARLGRGSANQVLTSDGTDIAWQTPAAGGGSFVWLQRQTASSSASLDFTSFISSTYDHYEFHFHTVLPASNSVDFLMRMGAGSFDSGANYHYIGWYNGIGDSLTGTGASSTTSYHVANSTRSATAKLTVQGRAFLYGPADSGYKQIVSDVTSSAVSDTSTYRWSFGGSWNSTSTVDRVQFLFSSGNVASGDIDVYGVKHA